MMMPMPSMGSMPMGGNPFMSGSMGPGTMQPGMPMMPPGSMMSPGMPGTGMNMQMGGMGGMMSGGMGGMGSMGMGGMGAMGSMMPLGPGITQGSPMGMAGNMMPRGRVGIMMEELPNQRILDERLLPPMPHPWGPPFPGNQNCQPQPLMPGQPTGIGADNLHPLQQQNIGELSRLPNAYRMYGYGPREITWSPQINVQERNTGVMINAEFPLQKHMEGREVAHYDDFIRNQDWQRQGAWVRPYDPKVDAPDWKHNLYGQYEQAQDLKRPRWVPRKDFVDNYYKDLHTQRDAKGIFEIDDVANRRMTLEMMDENELAGFWSNPQAVQNDGLD